MGYFWIESQVGTDEEKFIKGMQPKEGMKGREGSGGIMYASCTSMLVAIGTVFRQ